MIRILLVDSHKLLYSSIDALLSKSSLINLVPTVSDGESLQQICGKYKPDIVLLALSLTNRCGLKAFTYLQENCPTVKVIILLDNPDEACLQKVLACNATGNILKSDVLDFLTGAIESVSQGEKWSSPTLLPALLQAQIATQVDQVDELTERELVILQLLVEEKTDKEIALAVNLAERTVRCYLSNVYTKLGVNSRVGAAVEAIRRKLI